MSYKQLTQEKRYVIFLLNKRGETQKEIADEIGVHKSTISRELKRNKGKRGYRYKQAHRFALKRRENKVDQRITEDDWAEIERLIKQEWSPEQIHGRFEEEHNNSVSHTWIYEHIREDKMAGGKLHEHLRHPKLYKKRGAKDGRGSLSNRTSIDDRPDIVDKKSRVGDCEGDLVMGARHKGALVTTVERKSRFLFLGHVKRKAAGVVKEEQIRCLLPHRNKLHTITIDNGKEFAKHEELADTLDVDVYFAHPYSSWERGLSENTNGLVRQYFPKGMELKEVSLEKIRFVEDRLNNRPRKSLNYLTPYEVYNETRNQLTVALES